MSKATSAISRRGIEQILATGDQSGHAMEYEADRVFACNVADALSFHRTEFVASDIDFAD